MKSTIQNYLSRKITLAAALLFSFGFAQGQNVGIGQASPVSKLDVNGGLTVGATYSGANTAPVNGAIIQGNTGIGTSAPANRLHVVGSVRFMGDFVNQELVGVHNGTVQQVPFTNGAITPLTGTIVSITPQDGNGVNHSGVLVTGFARVFGGSLTGNNSSLGGYFMILQRDVNAGFTSPTNLTYTSGTCYIETPNGGVSASIGFGGGGHVSYVDNALTAGVTYYYRLAIYTNGVGITGGTYDVYQRDLAIVQLKR